MNSRLDPILVAMEETAAEWLARRRDGISAAAEAEYQAWLAEDPRHAAAARTMAAAWESVNFPVVSGQAREAARLLAARQAARDSRRRRLGWAAAGLAVAAAAVWALLPARPRPPAAPVREAYAVRPNIESLPDGSTAELNAGARIAVEFTAEKRAVRLIQGEALFAVAKNAARPFVVSAGGIEVRAVGTAFSVRFDPREVGVLVTEGRVAVERVGPRAPSPSAAAEGPAPIYLGAGGQIALALDPLQAGRPEVRPLSAEEMSTALAWRGRRVEFTRMRLAEAVALFNQQNRTQLAIGEPAAGDIPISGIFWADDPEGFARLLESALDVRAEQGNGVIELRLR